MSAIWNGQQLLQPITGDRPCGDNLEDTPLLGSFDDFRLFGHSTPLEPTPDWVAVKERSLEALSTSKDLRLLAHLAAASLRTDGLSAFVSTLATAADWLDAFWTETYPQLDDDAILRRNALNCLADQMAVIDGLRRLPLADSRQHGRFSLRDIDTATGALPAEDGQAGDQEQINAAFASMPLDDLQALEAGVVKGIAALNSIEQRMRAEAGPDAAPAFAPLSASLVRIRRVLHGQLAMRGQAETASQPGGDEATAAGAASRAHATTVVHSREDAMRTLDVVSTYFRRCEPSSPIPLLLERAKRLISRDFLEVLADMAPDALAQARSAAGIKPE